MLSVATFLILTLFATSIPPTFSVENISKIDIIPFSHQRNALIGEKSFLFFCHLSLRLSHNIFLFLFTILLYHTFHIIKRAFDNFFAQVFSLALCGIHIVSHILCESCRNMTVGANSVRPSDHMLSMGYAF